MAFDITIKNPSALTDYLTANYKALDMPRLLTGAGKIIVNSIAQNFEAGGRYGGTEPDWTGGSKKWQERSELTDKLRTAQGYTQLLQVTGAGRKFAYNVSKYSVRVFPSVNYIQHLHYGSEFDVTITDRMRKYFWYLYYRYGIIELKYMALTKKKQFHIKNPPRPIMVVQDQDIEDIEALAVLLIKRQFKIKG